MALDSAVHVIANLFRGMVIRVFWVPCGSSGAFLFLVTAIRCVIGRFAKLDKVKVKKGQAYWQPPAAKEVAQKHDKNKGSKEIDPACRKIFEEISKARLWKYSETRTSSELTA